MASRDGQGGPSRRGRGRDRSESVISETDDTPSLPHEAEVQKITSDTSAALRNLILRHAPLYKIVLTGGPCGGKTTALARLSSYLRERGFEVITCPEAFSILGSNGFQFEYFGTDGMGLVVQETIMAMQENLEDGFERVLRARGEPAVLLCDRGLMDGAAYMSSEDWNELLCRRGIKNVCELREGRYNAIFHLVTAAEGAQKYYTLENNEVRHESPEEARRVDGLTRSAWLGHPKLSIFDNSTDFEGKLQRLVDAAAELVGLPAQSRSTTKFLLGGTPDLDSFPDDIKYHIFNVEKVYLYEETAGVGAGTSPSSLSDINMGVNVGDSPESIAQEYSFVRKRTNVDRDGRRLGSAYGQTTVKRTYGGQEIEVKRIITRREYVAAYKTRDPSRQIVCQKRISFLYNMQSFNVHIYEEPMRGLCILHAHTRRSSPLKPTGAGDGALVGNSVEDVDLPPFLDVLRRLTNSKEDDQKYGAYSISQMQKQ
jgi:predicted ATPase